MARRPSWLSRACWKRHPEGKPFVPRKTHYLSVMPTSTGPFLMPLLLPRVHRQSLTRCILALFMTRIPSQQQGCPGSPQSRRSGIPEVAMGGMLQPEQPRSRTLDKRPFSRHSSGPTDSVFAARFQCAGKDAVRSRVCISDQ